MQIKPHRDFFAWEDPLGRMIALSMIRWREHILSEHPEMQHKLEEVRRTIQEPNEIRKKGQERHYYRAKRADRCGNKYTKVAVIMGKNRFGTTGFVATAYPVRMQRGGVFEWERKN